MVNFFIACGILSFQRSAHKYLHNLNQAVRGEPFDYAHESLVEP
jgi:hypothetical protein